MVGGFFVRDLMDVVFSVCIVTRGAVDGRVWSGLISLVRRKHNIHYNRHIFDH